MSDRIRVCTHQNNTQPAEVRTGSDEVWRQWLKTKPACPECGGRTNG